MECPALWNAQHYRKCFTIYLVLANQLCQSYFEGGATSSHLNSLERIQWCCLTQCTLLFKPFAIMTSLPLTGRVRNPVAGHESNSPKVVFNVHQSQTWQHTPQPFLPSQVPLIYMWSATQLGIVTYHTLGAMPAGWSPVHVLTGLMIA